MLDPSTCSCNQYSVPLWKTTNPFHLNRTNFHLEAFYSHFQLLLAMNIPTVCILLFVHGVANTVDPWLATERYNMSVLLIFFTVSMVVAATFLMFYNKSVLYFTST